MSAQASFALRNRNPDVLTCIDLLEVMRREHWVFR
jgi:hypothetical protein